MLLQSRLIRCTALIALLAVAMLWSGDDALAIQDSEDEVLFGPLGIVRGETVRVNVYGIGNPNEKWDFVVRIFNRDGKVVQERKLQLTDGVTGSFDVSIEDEENFPVDRLGRRTLRAEIVGFNPQPDPPGGYAATLEIINRSTGRTSILLGGPDTLPAPAVPR
ncbi:MAG: hypothetical protein ACHBNF_14770 [Chromatiales bacterium]